MADLDTLTQKHPECPSLEGRGFRDLQPLWHIVSRLKWIPAKTNPDGTLDFGSPYNEARWRQFCKDNKWVRIERPKVVRTLSQNALYWLFLEQICYETGNEADDLHEFFKSRLLPKKLGTIHGKKGDYDIERVKSTTELTKAEFGEYIDKISAMTGVALPDTEEWKKANGYLPS